MNGIFFIDTISCKFKIKSVSGNCALCRVLPQIFTQKSEPVIRNVDALVAMLENCGVSERVSLLQVFGMIAKVKPAVSVLYVVPFICQIN